MAAIKSHIDHVPGLSLGYGVNADYETISGCNKTRLDKNEYLPENQREESWPHKSMFKVACLSNSRAVRIIDQRPQTGIGDPPVTATIKTEPAPAGDAASSLLRSTYVETERDAARTEFRLQVPSADLTGERVTWSLHHDLQNSVIVHHAMQPDPAMDDVFPLRDPEHPRQVHPLYADEGDPSRTAPGVGIDKVEIAVGYKSYLQEFAANQRSKSAAERRLNMLPKEVKAAIPMLEQHARAELERTMQGIPQQDSACQVRKLEGQYLEPHEQALAGQYGVVRATRDRTGGSAHAEQRQDPRPVRRRPAEDSRGTRSTLCHIRRGVGEPICARHQGFEGGWRSHDFADRRRQQHGVRQYRAGGGTAQADL